MVCGLIVFFLQGFFLKAEGISIVSQGFDAYHITGSKSALDVWLKDSPLMVDRDAYHKLENDLARIQMAYGNYRGQQIVKTVTIAEGLTRVYAVLFLENGPIYISFDVYKKISSEIISDVAFSVKADTFFPPDLIYGK